VVQQQLAAQTAWRSDGCDLNRAALARHQHGDGRVLYYDIHDCRPELRAKYDFLVLFDVIEHIAEPLPFLTAAAYHLKPGGYAFINVPACQSLFSQYDAVQGHHRRYDKKLLRQQLAAAGLTVCALRYWGMFLLPALLARKLYVDRKSSPEEIYRAGFRPPNQLMSALLSAALAGETFLPPMPLGTSLLAIARKPG
jgi:2-polyprenyl-3-methyl-5-hydroxy-6-metoxy-1,4-benzoquinol methylase